LCASFEYEVIYININTKWTMVVGDIKKEKLDKFIVFFLSCVHLHDDALFVFSVQHMFQPSIHLKFNIEKIISLT
jgi:hypothetical protein